MAGEKFVNGRVSRFEFLTCEKEISFLIVLQLEKSLSMRRVGLQDMQII